MNIGSSTADIHNAWKQALRENLLGIGLFISRKAYTKLDEEMLGAKSDSQPEIHR
jgi:hypothetical protein